MLYFKRFFTRLSLTLVLFFLFTAITGLTIGCCSFSGTKYMGPVTEHFDGNKFYNQTRSEEHALKSMLKWSFNREPGEWPEWVDEPYGPPPPSRVTGDSMLVTFINHSTVLIQADGINIITDPVYSERVSPVKFSGPKRHRNPGIRFSDLSPIDVVLVSHNHYDHMDLETLVKINDKFKPVFLTSLGNKELLESYGINQVTELDWWQSYKYSGMNFTFVPAKHFSMRGICDRNKTQWGGFVFETSGGPVYFSGDTGFDIHFEQIFKKFGAMRFSMLPIGAYRPRWFMVFFHTSPDDAVLAHKILHSAQTMGIHWGTFMQADDGLLEPLVDLKIALAKHNISDSEFYVLKHGIGHLIPKLK